MCLCAGRDHPLGHWPRWRQDSISSYKNKLALKILHDLKTRIFFYERAFTNDDSFYNKSDNQHDSYISAIADDNVPTASLLLKMNWMLILDYIKRQLLEVL